MRAVWNDAVIANGNTVTLEGNHYFPPDALVQEHLRPSDHTSTCPWKGEAGYFDVVVGGQTNPNAAWIYRDPKPAASEIEGRVAFWKGVEVVD